MKAKAALAIGAGVGGIKASLDLAEAGFEVYLCERGSSIGGTITQMDRWFPDDHCGMCQLLPSLNRDFSSQYCLRSGLMHQNIKVLLNTEVTKAHGEAGNFEVTVCTNTTGVNPELCTGCGICARVCPVPTTHFSSGNPQKAIDLSNPIALPPIYGINWMACTRCGICVKKCPTGAIQLEDKAKTRLLDVGAIILSTGFEQFDAQCASQYGYRRYPNVLTNLELERMMSPSAPSGGKLVRPSDGAAPESIAFLQCIGSRERRSDYCSSACCMIAVKEAASIRRSYPGAEVTIFFMDLRAFGKGHHRLYQQAEKELGVQFVRSRIPVVREDPPTRNLILSVAPEGKPPFKRQFDMVILSVGQTPSAQFTETCATLGIETNKLGFCNTFPFSPIETTRQGIYVCGSASSPKDIADTITESGAAAGEASRWLKPVVAPQADGGGILNQEGEEEPKVGVLLCSCGGEIGSVLDLEEIARCSRGSDDVVHVSIVPYLCLSEVQEKIRQELSGQTIDRLVLGLCSTYCREPSLCRLAKDIGYIRGCVQAVNLREEIAWVHREHSEGATAKGKNLLRMAIEKMLQQKYTVPLSTSISSSAMVIGGGIAGMVAALAIAGHGLEVCLVEKTAELGGNLKELFATLEGGDVQQLLAETIAQVKQNEKIHLHFGTEVTEAGGYAGNFVVTVREQNTAFSTINSGAIIIASGGRQYQPAEYLYGQREEIITQRQLEQRLFSGRIDPHKLNTVVMLQCVGSRDEERRYCSRVCCSQALKNALRLKEINPAIELIIFYRDIMSYGFKEEYYTRAREKGVQFVRFDPAKKPALRRDGKQLIIEAGEPVLGGKLVIQSDLIVLSNGIIPHDNRPLARILGIEIDEDGFFREAEEKFRPVDSSKAGIFICGLAHSPRTVAESIVQARAAAHRAISLLLPGKLGISRNISRTIQRKCRKCELCISVCFYSARTRNEETDEIVVLEALCQGCGACAVACPSGAATVRGFEDKSVMAMLDTVEEP